MKTNITKHTRTSRTRGFLSALTGLALLMAAGSPAFAGKVNEDNSNIMPPQFHAYSQSFGIHTQWAERLAQLGPVSFVTLPGFSPAPRDLARFEKQSLSIAKRKFRSARSHVCPDDHSMPQMVHLVDLILAHQGTSSAFSIDASGRVQLTIPNDHGRI